MHVRPDCRIAFTRSIYITNRRRPISNYVNRERESDRIDFSVEQLYADERYRISQMDRNAIHARGMKGRGRWTTRIMLRKKCRYFALRTRQRIGARSDACYKSFRFTRVTRGDAHTRHYFHGVFLTALLHPISSPSFLDLLSFGKPSLCSRSECVRDDKRSASPTRSRMV